MAVRNYASQPYSNRANRLECQTGVHSNFDPQRLSGGLANHSKHLVLFGWRIPSDPAGLLPSVSWEVSCETQQGAVYE